MNEIKNEKSGKGWNLELFDEFSQEIGVDNGSIAVLLATFPK